MSTRAVPAFLSKLFDLVEDPTNMSIIAWTDYGTSFSIKDGHKFSTELLPQKFKHSNLASFLRQLNMYSFRKVRTTTPGGSINACICDAAAPLLYP